MSIAFSLNFKKPRRLESSGAPKLPEGLFFKGGNGCVVILIHGLTGTPHEMKFLAAYLNKRGYSVFCPRLANHGAPLGVLKNTPWQDFYQSARGAFLKVSKDYSTIFVGGLSMGALISLLLAQEFPEKISGVSCLSPTLFYDGWNMPRYRWLLSLGYHTPLKHFFYFKEEPPYGLKDEKIRQFVHKYYHHAKLHDLRGVEQYGYPFFPVALLYQLELMVKAVVKKLAQVTAPVQLIQAREDDMTSVKNSQFIYDRISSQKKELILLEDSYHVITADQEREKVAQKMDEFFASITQAKSTQTISHV